MKRSTIKSLSILAMAGSLFAFSSCRKMLDTTPQQVVDQAQMYRNVYDADAAVLGVYGKFMNVAGQYFLLNELRGDLTDVTTNADQYMKQISEHNATPDNPYINPRPIYEVILNCNDVLYNFQKMLNDKKWKQEEFNQRYSDIAALRTYLYLQLGIHYGEIPYVTDPLATIDDVHDQSKFPMLKLNPLIDTLVAFTERLPWKIEYPSGTTLITAIDGYSTLKFYINKTMLLGDLYLWDGQYLKAASQYKTLMEYGTTHYSANEAYYSYYKLSSFSSADGVISYSRATDATSLNVNGGWRYLFERGQDDPYNWEWIWALPFDKNFAPNNPFIDLMAPAGGRYLVRPSQEAIDNWNSQTQRNGFPFDARGQLTYKYINGQPVIMKYLYNYYGLNSTPINVFNKSGKWFLKRAATLHLHYAEAANRDGQYKLAWGILNRGIKDTYDPTPGAGKSRDVTNIQQTFLPFPYDFDAREGDAPAYRNSWYRSIGIRNRANLNYTVVPASDSLLTIENQLIQEDALELAYEGERWPDLLRVAIRRNDPKFLADKVYSKLLKSGVSAAAANNAYAKLIQGDWFLPFKWQ